MRMSLVIPVYKNEENIAALVEALDQLSSALQDRLEVVFVVDGSPDRSFELLSSLLPRARFPSQLASLSRNFGSFAAIRAGLAMARGDNCAVMAADLQEPPELIHQFDEMLRSGQWDVVVGTRAAREDPLGKRLSSALFWSTYRRLVQKEMPSGGIDCFGCNSRFKEHLLQLPEQNSTLVGLVIWMGYRRAEVPYVRRARQAGKSAWSLRKRVRYLLDSVFSFSDLPIRMLTIFGTLGMAISAALGIFVFICRLTGKINVPGYAGVVLAVTFFGGLNALGLGIIGEYTWRILENTRRRPMFLLDKTLEFGGSRHGA